MDADEAIGEFPEHGDPVVASPHGSISAAVNKTPPKQMLQDPAALGRLFEACDEQQSGLVPARRLLQHLSSALPTASRAWLLNVLQVLDPAGEDCAVSEAMLRDAVRAVDQAELDLLQPGAVSDSPLSSPSPAARRLHTRFSTVSKVSSLGILNTSQLTDTSLSSYEGFGQQLSPVDVPALENTIAQLEHSARALQEERDQLQSQLQQLEESNMQLSSAVCQLTDRNSSLTAELGRISALRAECERLHQALEAETLEKTTLREQAGHVERLLSAQQQEIDQLGHKLSAAEGELQEASARERCLQRTLDESRRESDWLRQDLQDRDDRNTAAQNTIASLHATIRDMRDTSLTLQEEKQRCSDELSSVRRQLTSMRSAPGASSQPSSTPTSGSIHDEIISTIQTTGDGDPELPLSGIASPELVHAICATPPNLNCREVPRRLLLASTPSAGPLPAEQDVLEEHYCSAASDSSESWPAVWRLSGRRASGQQSPAAAVSERACQTAADAGSHRATQTAPETTGDESSAVHLLLWELSRLAQELACPTFGDIYEGEQNNNTTKECPAAAEAGQRPQQASLGSGLDDSAPARHAGDSAASLLHQAMAFLQRQEAVVSGNHASLASSGVDFKRTNSDSALSGTQRPRFCSMPTVEEDPDIELPQHSPLRASFSLPCVPNEVSVFPSLTDPMLADLQIEADENANNTNEKDLESKFSSLALAFKTDRLTLHERLDVQRRHRDQAEANLELEAQRFRDQLMMLSQSDVDLSDQLKSLQRQLDIIKQISQRLSRTAEVLGAAQQELRVSRAVEVMTQHVESLRHLYERERAELEEARRVLAVHNIALHEPAVAAGKAGPPGRRRASIAVFAPRQASQPATASPPMAQLLKRRRNSLGAGDADIFGAITEEREDERESEERTKKEDDQLPPDEDGSDSADPADQEEQLRSDVEEAVSDELATLRSEQEQLANDLKTLLSRQRDAVLHQTTTVGKLLWDVAGAWPYSREQTVVRARYCVGGLFLLLAVMVLLVPPAYTSCDGDRRSWHSWSELLYPHLSLHHVSRPPL